MKHAAFILLILISSVVSVLFINQERTSAITCLEDGQTRILVEKDGVPPTPDDCEGEVILAVDGELCAGKPFLDRDVLGIPYWYKYLNGTKDIIIYEGEAPDQGTQATSGCAPTIRNTDDELDPRAFLGIGLAVIEGAMVLAGLAAVVMVIWGGFQFVLTQGEPDKAAAARRTVINAAIGLVIIIISTQVVSFIATRLTTPAPSGQPQQTINGGPQ